MWNSHGVRLPNLEYVQLVTNSVENLLRKKAMPYLTEIHSMYHTHQNPRSGV